MKTTALIRVAGVLMAACLSMGLVRAGFAPGTNLYLNGGLASSRVIQHDGIAYAPIADIAKALNQTVVTKADGFAITPAGGTGQLNGMNGKIGDKLTNGQWVFTVVKAFRTDKYMHQFATDSSAPGQATDDLVIVVVRIKNARQESAGISLPGTGSTSITDLDEHSYSKMTFGGMDDRAGYPTLLPGSAVDFAMCFSFPKNEKLGDFVYQVYPSSGPKPPTFRVSLASLNP